MSSWQTKIKQVVAQCRPPNNAKLKLVYIIKYFHLLPSSQWRSMQWNSPLVHNGMPQGTINSSRSSIKNSVSCLHDWSLFANTINYSRLSQLIALRNLTNSTCINSTIWMHRMDTNKVYRAKAKWELHKNCPQAILNKPWKQHPTKQQL